jgi:hypothetical protein
MVNIEVRRATTRYRTSMSIARECLFAQARRDALLRTRHDVIAMMDRTNILPITLRTFDRRR